MDADIQAIRDQFLGQAFDEKQFEIDPTVTAEYARLCGETLPKFTDPADPDFQASPTFVASLSGGAPCQRAFLVLVWAWMRARALSACNRCARVSR